MRQNTDQQSKPKSSPEVQASVPSMAEQSPDHALQGNHADDQGNADNAGVKPRRVTQEEAQALPVDRDPDDPVAP